MSALRRRLMMQCAETKVNCVTSIVNPCDFDSTGGRNSVSCVFANVESGKTYKVIIKATITVINKVDNRTSDLYIKYYSVWHNDINYRAYNIAVGTTTFDSELEHLCYMSGENIPVLALDTTNVKGTMTVEELVITEV